MFASPMQILVIALIILLLFGASRLGEVGKGLGNLKKGLADDPASKRAVDSDEAPNSSAAVPAVALAEALQANTENGSPAEAEGASAQGQALEGADQNPPKPDPSAS